MNPMPLKPPSSHFGKRKGRIVLLGVSKSLASACQSAATAMHCELVTVKSADGVREKIKDSLPTCVVIPLTSEYLHELEDRRDAMFRRLAMVIIGEDKIVQHLQDTQLTAFTVAATKEAIQAELDIGIKQAVDLQWKWSTIEGFRYRLDLLTTKEREVLNSICHGALNKQIAKRTGVSIRTIEQRRRRVFEKMEVVSAIPLVAQLATFNLLMKPLGQRDQTCDESNKIVPTPNALRIP